MMFFIISFFTISPLHVRWILPLMYMKSNWNDAQKTSQGKREAPYLGVEAQLLLQVLKIY